MCHRLFVNNIYFIDKKVSIKIDKIININNKEF